MKLFKLLLVFVLVLTAAHARVVTIFHFNDFHGHIAPFEQKGVMYGGGGALASMIRHKVEKVGECIVLDGGDTISGSSEVNPFNGRPSIQLFNKFPLSAAVLGNHEFDFGTAILERRMAEANFPFIAANVSRFDAPFVKPYKMFTVNGVKVAVIGLITPDTLHLTNPAGTVGVRFDDPVEVAAKYMPYLRERAEIVVAVTHMGVDADVELAQQVPGFDVIVGGHSHTELPEGLWVGDTLIVQAGYWGAHLGVVEIYIPENRSGFAGRTGFADSSGSLSGPGLAGRPDFSSRPRLLNRRARLIPVLADYPVDSDIAEFVEKHGQLVDLVMGQVVGSTPVPLSMGINLRSSEHAMGRWIADSMREMTGADVVLLNSGGIRQGIPAGDIALRDLMNIMPFNNEVEVLRLSGHKLKQTVKHGISSPGRGSFLQVSGIEIEADIRAGEVSFRKLKVGGRPVTDDAEFVVAVNSFMGSGGDGYSLLVDAPRIDNPMSGKTDVEVIREWLAVNREVRTSKPGRMIIRTQ